MTVPGTSERPLRVAVVGSGPSGFYTAQALFDSDLVVDVAVYDRLPSPFGLVRYGVAPDHAKIKNVIRVYEKTAAHDRFSFFGNVTVPEDLTVAELRTFHDAVIIACGAETDRNLGIEGEDLPGSYTATEFVAWYNGHPDYQDRIFDLHTEVAVVIGQGNVATDVCRILCKTVAELRNTDIAQHALEVLAESKIRKVHMIGRRGPVQAAFTPSEIREFGELADCDPIVDPADLRDLGRESEFELSAPQRRRNLEALEHLSRMGPSHKARRFAFHFLKSPKRLCGNGKVESVILERNELIGEAGNQKARGTGETEKLSCGALFRSVGYRGIPISGVPFDAENGTIPNDGGRIRDGDETITGLYAVGWIKRGPTGVIGTNKPDSQETVRNLLADVPRLPLCEIADNCALLQLLQARGVQVVDYEGWKKIDAAEIARGRKIHKPREKFVDRGEMLAVNSGRAPVL